MSVEIDNSVLTLRSVWLLRVIVATTRKRNAVGWEARDLDFNPDTHLPPTVPPIAPHYGHRLLSHHVLGGPIWGEQNRLQQEEGRTGECDQAFGFPILTAHIRFPSSPPIPRSPFHDTIAQLTRIITEMGRVLVSYSDCPLTRSVL